ncbi:uncharacterized protein [Aegilops tauschii subsp. strangulata]|uniref:uncharacterized protein n=1 Tax=Aegilops tauschii subsp. strangulata TaxID=200361 RepID=UPI003CC85C99
MSVAANSATSPLPSAPDVEVDAEADEEVPRHDDEDEILFPELVDTVSQQAVEDEYAEEPSTRARFDDTDDEEREENIDSLVLQEYDGEDMPTIEWNMENPDLTPGTEYMDEHHGKLWSRSKFNEIYKVDNVNNNLAECFNAKFKSVKGLLLWQAFDKIRQMIMVKMALRKRIAETQYVGHLMLPSLIKALHAKARGLRMKCIRPSTYEAEVTYTDSKNREWRYPVNLATNECSCRQWQIRGKPCIDALHLMTVIGGEDGEVDQYCSEYFSVAKFRVAYAENVPALLGKDQWNIVDPGFKLHSPVLTRPPGRPRKNRIRAGEEGRVKKQRKCKRCDM